MRVIMRFYKSHDADLIALQKNGFSLPKLARNVIEGYAHGERIKVMTPECGKTDISSLDTLRCDFSTSDERTIHLLESIEKKRRNQFCKAMIRNALIAQPITIFFTDPEMIEMENSFLRDRKSDCTVITLPLRNRKGTRYAELTEGLKDEYMPEKWTEQKPIQKEEEDRYMEKEEETLIDISGISGLLSSMVQEF